MTRRAKIVGTVGPASNSEAVLRRLLKTGLDVVRLNLSHGTAESHKETFESVRKLASEASLHVPIVLDLMGPRYRLGQDQPETFLRHGELVSLGAAGDGADLTVDQVDLLTFLRPGDRILIDNGLVELRVREASRRKVTAKVRVGGAVASRKGINLPDSDLPFVLSGKDRADIQLAVELGADYLAASYVGSASDVQSIRRTVTGFGGQIPIVAKLERARAVKNLDALVGAADAVMVARGDLGVEVPLHKVPIIQKRIIESGRRHGKPVIVATQMLESMMTNSRPTRAESSDVANAVLDGADALMLSGESAVGRYPVEAVRTMDRIIREAESYARSTGLERSSVDLVVTDRSPEGDRRPRSAPAITAFEIADTIAAAAVHATRTLKLRHVVAFSQGGFTARVISRYRPAAPIWMLTIIDSVARRVQLSWGVRPLLLTEDVEHHDEVISRVDCELLRHGLAEPGDAIAVLMGDPIRERPLTNLLRIHRVRDDR